MGHKLLLDVNPAGIQHHIETDEDGFYSVEHAPTVVEQAIVDECSKLRGLNQRKGSGFQFAGKVPLLTHQQWKQEWLAKYRDTVTWPTFLAQKMNSREFSKLNIGGKLPTAKRRHI